MLHMSLTYSDILFHLLLFVLKVVFWSDGVSISEPRVVHVLPARIPGNAQVFPTCVSILWYLSYLVIIGAVVMPCRYLAPFE